MADSAFPATAFAVDIGVYVSGGDGVPLHGTTFAWAKRTLPLKSGVAGGEPMPVTTSWSAAAHSIPTLIDELSGELRNGRRVAVTFEAPMWLPLFSQLSAEQTRLFQPRFRQERSREWYLAAGAAATTKAISISALLLTLLRQRNPNLQPTTSKRRWEESKESILLLEAFVAGSFKLPTPPGADRDEWDAQTAAVATALWLSPSTDTPFLAELLVAADDDAGSALSIWEMAARAASLSGGECRGRCNVVGLQPKAPG